MKCFHYFKDKSRLKEQKSAPTLKNQNKFHTSETDGIMKSSSSAPSPRSIPELYQEKAQNLRVFKFSELKQATSNFNRLLKIGEGGFGAVYKGTIKPVDGNGDPFIVAIKKLNRHGTQGHKEWVREVTFLGVVDHPNLVKLIGYCAVDAERGIQRLLVYEYMPNKSLDHHLFNPSSPTLSWDQRLQVLLGAAKGLAYLHEEIQIQVIYRDFKSSNVLLDEDFRPKLSDFGLAREGPVAGETHVSTAVVGTHGYAAPDYIETGHLTCESDVWSFGIVLYEILTGRRSLEKQKPRSQQNLLDWVKQYPPESKKFSMIIDSRLEHMYSLKAAQEVAKLAERCVLKSRRDRPKMSQVVESLKQIVEISVVESSSGERYEGIEDEAIGEEPVKESAIVESVKRRMKHLAKISENLDVDDRRRFMMMQKAKVT